MSGLTRMEIAVYPLGSGETGVSREVSRIFEVLDRRRLTYQVTVMGTVVEGTPDELFSLARELHDAVFCETIKRVVTVMRIDERRP